MLQDSEPSTKPIAYVANDPSSLFSVRFMPGFCPVVSNFSAIPVEAQRPAKQMPSVECHNKAVDATADHNADDRTNGESVGLQLCSPRDDSLEEGEIAVTLQIATDAVANKKGEEAVANDQAEEAAAAKKTAAAKEQAVEATAVVVRDEEAQAAAAVPMQASSATPLPPGWLEARDPRSGAGMPCSINL